MPRYELTTDEELTRSQRDALAREITDVHATATGAPPCIVHVVFWTTGAGNAYVGGDPRPGTYLQGSVRASRDPETIAKLLHGLAAALCRITGADARDVTVAFRETPTHLVLEGGRIVGEPGAEDPAFIATSRGDLERKPRDLAVASFDGVSAGQERRRGLTGTSEDRSHPP